MHHFKINCLLLFCLQVNKANEVKPTEADESVLRPIRRGRDFTQLLSKFSTSEASASDPDPPATGTRKGLGLFRQDKVVAVSSSDESSAERRTPERTHSLRIRSPNVSEVKVQRSGSFKSEFMRRRYSIEKTDKPDEELQSVLNQRCEIVEKQETEARKRDFGNEREAKVEKAEKTKFSDVDEVIADKEVLAVLRARRKETDERNNSQAAREGGGSEHTNTAGSKSNIERLDSSLALLNKVKNELDSPVSSSDLDISSTAYIPLSPGRKRSSSENIANALKYVHDVESTISSCISSTSHAEGASNKMATKVKGQDVSNLELSSQKAKPESTDSVSYTVSLAASDADSKISSSVNKQTSDKRLSEEKDFVTPLLAEEKWVTDRRHRKDRNKPSDHLFSDLETLEVTLPTSRQFADDVTSACGQQEGSKVGKSGRDATSLTISSNNTQLQQTDRGKVERTSGRDAASLTIVSNNTQLQQTDRGKVEQTSGNDATSANLSSTSTHLSQTNRQTNRRKDEGTLGSDVTSAAISTHTTQAPPARTAASGLSSSVDQKGEEVPSSGSTNLRRAESLKERGSPVTRADSFQKRKGILKRTPSLPKQSSPVIVDQELAKLLQRQKSRCEGSSESEGEGGSERVRTKSISALEEIDEVSR